MEQLQNQLKHIYNYIKQNPIRFAEDILLLTFILSGLSKLQKSGGIYKGLAKIFIRLLKKSKFINKQLTQSLSKEAQSAIEQELLGKPKPQFCEIPVKGESYENLRSILKQYQQQNANPNEGKMWAYVYEHSKEHSDFVAEAFQMFIHTNALNPIRFISLKNMEVEVVAMTASMFNGNPCTCVGNITSGGTESLLLAVKTYRDYGIAKNPDISQPEMVMCETAHAGLFKAAKHYGVKVVLVPYDPKTYQMDVGATEKAITQNTVLIICSAPQYCQGVIDPIEEISNIALKHNIPVHVDSAIGGFVLPWIEKLGYIIPKFDFRCMGVTSISADVHKYGFAPKGSSVLVYRSSEYRKFQFFVIANWPAGLYASPTLLGTRNGGTLASAWASLRALGQDGFIKITKVMIETVNFLVQGINSIPELQVLGQPQSTIIAFKSKQTNINIFGVADALEEIGWHMERSMQPQSIHCTVMPQHVATRDQFIHDLKQCVNKVKSNPEKYNKKGSAAMYGMIGSIPDECIVEDFMLYYLDQVYSFKK